MIGALAGPAFQYQGAGSSFVNAARPESLLQALRAAGQKVRYEPGYSVQQGTGSAALAARAVHLAKRAHTVVYCMGLTDLYETEGYDRTHLRLPGNQLALLRRLAAVNPRVVVLLSLIHISARIIPHGAVFGKARPAKTGAHRRQAAPAGPQTVQKCPG